MEKKEFKVGDRVKITGCTTGHNAQGDIGTIHKLVVIGGHDFAQINVGGYSNRYLESCHTRLTSLTHDPLPFPEKWCIKSKNTEQTKVISNWCNENKIGNEGKYMGLPTSRIIYSEGVSMKNNYKRAGNHHDSVIFPNFTEITFEQFLENIVNVKKEKTFEPLPFFKILNLNNQKITLVQNNEGNVFGIGDYVIGVTEYSKKLGSMKIISFRKTVNTDNICAITEQTTRYGIGIDKIQHVIKELPIKKQALSLEDLLTIAKEKYTTGIKFIRIVGACKGQTREINGYCYIGTYLGEPVIYCNSYVVYHKGIWAEIVSKKL